MNNKYEAAEVVVVGTAAGTILGEKDFPSLDSMTGEFWREETQMFDE